MRDIMENNLVKIYDEENEKFWFGVSEVNRYQDEEDDPWWNVRIIYKNHWVNYDEIGESMTELELKAIADEIEKRVIREENNNSERFGFIEPDYGIEFEANSECAIFIINMGSDSIQIWLDKEGLIKIYNCICDTLKYKKNRE